MSPLRTITAKEYNSPSIEKKTKRREALRYPRLHTRNSTHERRIPQPWDSCFRASCACLLVGHFQPWRDQASHTAQWSARTPYSEEPTVYHMNYLYLRLLCTTRRAGEIPCTPSGLTRHTLQHATARPFHMPHDTTRTPPTPPLHLRTDTRFSHPQPARASWATPFRPAGAGQFRATSAAQNAKSDHGSAQLELQNNKKRAPACPYAI